MPVNAPAPAPAAFGAINPALAIVADRLGPRARKALAAALAAEVLWKAGRVTAAKLRDRTRYTVSVGGGDELYDDVHRWLIDQIPPERRRSVAVSFRRASSHDDAVPATSSGGRRRSKPKLGIAYDGASEQTVDIGGHQIAVTVGRRDSEIRMSDDRGGSYREYLRTLQQVTFTAQSTAGRDAVLGVLQGLADRRSAVDRAPTFRVADRWGGWSDREEMRRRTLASVVLADGQQERIVADLAQFLGDEDEYVKLGIPWHRGYLFEGPPGTGKTSLAVALANHFGLDVYYVPLSDLQEDGQLLGLIHRVSPRSMLLLEDVDVAAATRQRDDATDGVTMSGLLNALDGIATPHGLITVMTTNNVEVLDDALIRPGRIDMREHIGLMDGAQFRRLVESLTGLAGVEWVGDPVAPAVVVEAVKRTMHEPDSARRVWELLSAAARV